MREFDQKYYSYAEDVLSGKVVAGRYIKLACERYLSFFEREDMYFDPEKCDRCINFISKLRHFSGKSANKHFILEEWQKWIIYSIFGFHYKETGLRVTNKVFILIARKNGKSAFASALCLYCLIAEGEQGAQVLNVATSREQGKLLFDMEVNFCKSIDPKGKYIKSYRDRLKFDKTKSYSRCLSSDASGLDGLSASTFVCDETHEYRDNKLWNVLISSQGFRNQPLAIQISTAGFLLGGFCHKYRAMCIDILNGLLVDDGQFIALYELDEGDDYRDESNWLKCNPNLDVTVNRKYLRDQITMAKNNPSLEVGCLTKNFNMWCSSSETWIPSEYIENSLEEFDLDKFGEDDIAYIGVDLASVSDITAVSVMVPYEGKCYFKNYYYLPESTLEGNSNSEKYKEWHRLGYLNVTPGNVCDYEVVKEDLLRISKKVMIHTVAYDLYNALSWAVSCTEAGLPLEPFSQGIWRFNSGTKLLEILIKSGKVVIDSNPITKWMFENTVLRVDSNDNCKPSKVNASSQQKIDGVISMIEALSIFSEQPQYKNDLFVI